MSIDIGFIDQSTTGAGGPITDWAWTFGDGGTSTDENPSHSYAAPGVYSVTLTVTSPDGTATTTHSVSVGTVGALAANFTDTPDGSDSHIIHFVDTSTRGPSGPLTAWAWNFGDGGTSTSQNPSHTYVNGTYTVTLTVTGSGSDGTATRTHSVTVTGGGASYQPYLLTSSLNKKIPVPAPIHPDSSLMISSTNHWVGTGTWLGPRPRPTYSREDTSLLSTVTMYANNNGWVGAGPYSMPMPSWAASVIGPTSQRGDSHLVLVDEITGDVWECWHTTPPGYTPRDSGFPSGRWNCSAYRHWAADTTSGKGYGAISPSFVPGTSASHIHIAAGLLVPEDFADCFSGSDPGTVIPHALRVGNFCGSKNETAHPSFVGPAYGGDGQQPEGIPAGGRIQLDPSINVATWPSVVALREPWRSGMKKMLRTMQVYGIVQVDSTFDIGAGNLDCASPASVAEGGTTYSVGFKFPNEVAGYGWGLANGVPGDLMSKFRVIDWTKWTGA